MNIDEHRKHRSKHSGDGDHSRPRYLTVIPCVVDGHESNSNSCFIPTHSKHQHNVEAGGREYRCGRVLFDHQLSTPECASTRLMHL